jgi:outer membrane lipoprotein-sorting protein
MRTGSLIASLGIITALAFTMNAQTNTFTYQGRLIDAAAAANGTYQMQFSLYDALTGGAQQGTTIVNNSVTVTNGVFTVALDFSPATPFAAGADRWIEIAVRKAADPPGFTTLTPRQQITSAPFATRSSSAANADAATTAGNVTGVVAVANGGTGSSTQNFVDLSTNQNVGGTKTFTNPIAGDGSQLTSINGANITNNTINASALAPDTFPNSHNLSLLGQLRWDLLGQRISVGINPYGTAFDGANIWVTNNGGSSVTKIRVNDGTILGTFTFSNNPAGIAFDGVNMWVAISNNNNVVKLRASDGVNLGTFAVGTSPLSLAFDGANIWVVNGSSNNVTKLRASDGANLGTFAVGGFPEGIAFDGANIWVANGSSNNVTKLRAADGVNLGNFPVGSGPYGVAFDGANIWVANLAGGSVTKLRASDGACVGTCTFAVDSPYGVAFDGANLWIGNNSGNVTKLKAADGSNLGTYLVGAAPRGIVFDGASMWVANLGSNNVIKLPVFP